MGHFADECHAEKKKKGKEEKANLVEESDEESALMILSDREFSENLLQGGDDVKCDVWYLDTGASSHMTGIISFFHSINKNETGNVNFGDGSSIEYEGRGNVEVICKNGEEIKLEGVLYLPKLKTNILSLGRLDDQGCKTSLSGGYLTIRDKKGRILTKTKKTRGNMYQIKLVISESCNLSREDEAWLWHERLCHQSFFTLDSMIKGKLVRGLPVFDKPKDLCSTCISGKHAKSSFKSSVFKAENSLDLVHMDLCGPIKPKTFGGRSYFLLIVDDSTRYMWIYLLSIKAEALKFFKKFRVMAEAEVNRKLKCARSDRGGEFLSTEFILYCEENGILRQLTAPYTPQQNGVVERRNRTIMGLVRSMLKGKKLPLELWGEAVTTCTYILNRSATKSLRGKTPYECWFGRKPSVDHLRIFGSLVHVKVTGNVGKLEDRSQKMVFVGYVQGSKAYRCIDPETRKISMSRDVIFEESKSLKFSVDNPGSSIPYEDFNTNIFHSTDEVFEESTELPLSDSIRDGSLIDEEPLRYRSIQDVYEETNLYLLSMEEPCSYAEASKEEVWRSAMAEEISAIERNKTWCLVKAPPGIKPIGVKWVFRSKKDQTGAVVKHKARLVAKGYSQKFGIDYEEIFAPVARFDSIRILIAIAAQLDWNLHHLDVKSAFLNGEIKEDLYVMQPEGFVIKGKESHVLKLTKALYGLKQAPRVWNSKLNKTMDDLGFEKSKLDAALYYKGNDKERVLVGIYVDDLIITGPREEKIEKFKEEMKEKFEMTDLGLLSSYLGMEVRQTKANIFLSQRAYINHVLKAFKMDECNAIQTPMEVHLKLQRENQGKLVNSTNFRSLIGSLRYLMNTRPDITFCVSYLSRFMDKPSSEHLAAAKRILRYLKGTVNFGVSYKKGDRNMKITGFSDSDFAGDINDRKSTSGQIFFLGGLPIKLEFGEATSGCSVNM